MRRLSIALIVAALAFSTAARADEAPLKVFSAGSLRGILDVIAESFHASTGIPVQFVFAPAGQLRERVEKGEPADLFASSDMGTPDILGKEGLGGPTVIFVRNQFCAFVRPGLKVTPENFLSTILDPAIKLGASAPKLDPAGDYTWAMFDKAETVKPGSRAVLIAKTLKFGGTPDSLPAPPPGEKSPQAWLMRQHLVDLTVFYCTGGPDVVAALPGTTIVHLPRELAVTPEYGLTVLTHGDQARASRFALFILSPVGQGILAKYGFGAPLLPGS